MIVNGIDLLKFRLVRLVPLVSTCKYIMKILCRASLFLTIFLFGDIIDYFVVVVHFSTDNQKYIKQLKYKHATHNQYFTICHKSHTFEYYTKMSWYDTRKYTL